MKSTKPPITDATATDFIDLETVISMWPISPAPTPDKILQWSRAGKFVPAFRAISQKEPPMFDREAVVALLEKKFAPVFAKRRAKKSKGGRDV